MKNRIIFLGVFILTLFQSCESLNTEPSDFVATEFYYNSEANLNSALTGVYDMLANGDLYGGGNGLITVFDCTDEMYFRSAASAIGPWSYNYNSSYYRVQTVWQRLYQGIERANMLLAHIDDVEDISDENKTVIEGQARFLRAYFYFVLVQNFGDVPLKSTPTTSAGDVDIARTSSDEVYQFVYDEMTQAEEMLKPVTAYTNAGRISKSAAQGIIARVCLYWAGFPNNNANGYQNALTWAEKVIQSGNHSLNSDYSQVFINLIQDKYDLNESIWEIEYYLPDITDTYESGQMGNNNGISQNILEYGYATGQYKVQEKLYRKYEDDDVRRDWAIAPYYYSYNSNPPVKKNWTSFYNRNIGKYRREYELTENKSKNQTGTNFPLLRYSDVLLMAAEAENEINGPTSKAYEYINEVRLRANASILTTGMSKDEFRATLQDERSRELCFEGWRRLDLIRWGIFIPTMKELVEYVEDTAPSANIRHASAAGNNVSEIHYYLPIPIREFSLNKLLTQNPGW